MSVVEVISGRGSTSRILRKVVVSLAVGVLAYLITALTNQSEIWSVTLSVFVGGVTMVVHSLIEFEDRLGKLEATHERHLARVEQLVETSFVRINKATALLNTIEASALHTETIIQLAQHATMVESAMPVLVSRVARAEFGRVSDLYKGLSEGLALYEGEDRNLLLWLTRHADSSIDATSLTRVDTNGREFIDGGLWTSELGQRYLDEQDAAIRRGVRVRRVFIVHDERDRNAEHHTGSSLPAGVLEVCRRQVSMGIEVRALPHLSLALSDTTYDFALFDQVVSCEATPASQLTTASQPVINTRIEVQKVPVQRRVQRFNDLWESAQSAGSGVVPDQPTKRYSSRSTGSAESEMPSP